MFYILIIDSDKQIVHTKPREPDLKCTQPYLVRRDVMVCDVLEITTRARDYLWFGISLCCPPYSMMTSM